MDRLEKAAKYLEMLAEEAESAEDADSAKIEECRKIASILRQSNSHQKRALNKAVWASVFHFLGIKMTLLALTIVNELTFAEKGFQDENF